MSFVNWKPVVWDNPVRGERHRTRVHKPTKLINQSFRQKENKIL